MHAHAANACGGAPMHRAVGAQVGAVQQLAAQEHWRATSAALSALAGGAADRSATASHASANALAPSLPALQGLPAHLLDSSRWQLSWRASQGQGQGF